MILTAVALIQTPSNLQGAMRINGNQVLSSAGAYGSLTARRSHREGSGAQMPPSGLIFQAGQAVVLRGSLAGAARSPSVATRARELGLGLSFDIAHVVYGEFVGGTCPIVQTGDVNLSGAITSADVITVVNFVFKGGASPMPCQAAADVDCSGAVTSSDIIRLVNFVFKGGIAPCDGCTSPLVTQCP
jgi:hypothetical protein